VKTLSLKELCKKKGFTLTEIARKTNTTVDYLSKLNTGKRKNPTWQFVNRIATILGVSESEVGKSITKED
jgi:transcriptional regulator with XRE-family HTH domain